MWHDVGKIIANLETNKIAPTICQCDRINAECVCVSVWPSIWPIDLLFVLQLTLEMTHTHEPTFRSFKWKTISSCMKTWRKNAHTKCMNVGSCQRPLLSFSLNLSSLVGCCSPLGYPPNKCGIFVTIFHDATVFFSHCIMFWKMFCSSGIHFPACSYANGVMVLCGILCLMGVSYNLNIELHTMLGVGTLGKFFIT